MSHPFDEKASRRAVLAGMGAVGLAALLGPRKLLAEAGSLDDGSRPRAEGDVGRILERSHGTPVDHIALGVPDMPSALEQIARETGAQPYSTDPEPGQWYWSGALALGDDGFLEILGPNPDHDGFNPIKQIISGYEEPRLLFWYVATDDFDRFTTRMEDAGAPMERIETVDFERDGVRSHYKRGVMGPGFVTQRPCVIEWRQRHDRPDVDRRCRLESFALRHPEAETMNRVFEQVGIDQVVEEGPSWISLTLSTPNGPVVYENEGESFAGAGALWRMTTLYLSYLAS